MTDSFPHPDGSLSLLGVQSKAPVTIFICPEKYFNRFPDSYTLLNSQIALTYVCFHAIHPIPF